MGVCVVYELFVAQKVRVDFYVYAKWERKSPLQNSPLIIFYRRVYALPLKLSRKHKQQYLTSLISGDFDPEVFTKILRLAE